MVRKNPIYNNVPGAREAQERSAAWERQRNWAQGGAGAGPFGALMPERNQLARMADAATLGQPIDQQKAVRLQRAAADREIIDQGLRQKAIDEAINPPGQPTPRGLGQGMPMPTGSPGGYRASFAPKAKQTWDPFDNPDMTGMTGMQKREAREARGFSEGGTLVGPGGPTDDMIPGVVDGSQPVRLSSGERVQKASTRDWYGEKFFVDLDKKADKERAEFEADKLRPKSRHRTNPMPVLDAETSEPIPGYAGGGTLDAIGRAASRARIREQEGDLSPVPYSPNMNDSPVFQPLPAPFEPDPGILASLRQRRRDLRAMPEFNQDQQPPVNVASPLEVPAMRPAPLSPSEKDRLNMPLRPGATPRVEPDFEATLVGESGMAKRRARAAYLREQALWNRDDQRMQVKQAGADTREQQNRARDFEDWKRKQVIASEIDRAAKAEERGFQGTLLDQQRKEREAREAMDSIEGIDFIESDRGFIPVMKTKGGAVKPAGGFFPNREAAPAQLTPAQIESLRKAGASIAIGPDGTRVTYPRAQPEKPATVKIFNETGDIKDWPADYDPPTGWSEAYPKGQTPRSFATPEEAQKANLKPGDRVMVGGKWATWK
jgi:hypothetical protein